MAFGKKYFSSYKSNNNLDYYLEIFLEDFSGDALELVMGVGGPVIEYETDQEDRFSPIISSSCKIPYLVENYLDSLFIDDLRNNYQERQVYVHIYRSTQSGHSAVAPLWSGFLVMDIGSGVDKYFPYEEHLKFVDGLSLLKDIDFVDLGVSGGTPPFEERVQGNYAVENMYYGPATYIFWIREILAKSGAALTNQGASQNYGFTTSVNWYNGEMNATGQSSDPLHKTKCSVSMFHRKDDQGVFYPDNCYNVLKELLRHWGARITYWKHEFWIVQIPEYITSESGTISTPVNNNSRLYSNTGAYQGSQNHLGSTFYTRYEQTIENDKISKLSGTKYNYLPLIKQVNADFLSFSSKSYFGGFPFGSTAPTQEVWQGTINSPSAADFLYLSIPLDWTWDMSQAGNVNNNLSAGHTMGWWCAVKFNFYAAQEDPNTGVITTYYLQYNFSDGSYYWVDSALWTPLGGKSPRYTISSKLAVVSGHIGFEKKIPFQDENGSAISMTGAWSFFLDIEDYGTSSSNPGSFYCNFSGYNNPTKMRNPQTNITIISPLGVPLKSGTVSWSNTLVDQQGQVTISSINNPAGFNAGTVATDIRFATTSPFIGLLQTLNNAQSASNGETFNVINSNLQAKQNSEQFDFGTLLWGDSLEFAPSSLQVFNGSTYVNTEPSGEWGRGILTGNKTFTKMLIDEFFSGQTKIIISPSMRLAVGVANKNEDQSGTLRPRYVNPIGKLRETRDGTDPEYFFRRGSFYTLLDEWDYEGYEIIRNVPSTTTQSNGMGSMGGSQSGSPAPSGMSPNLMVQALSQNSPLAYIRTTIPATGSNVAVNGNFNTAVGWSLGTGWSIDTTAKKAKFAATGSTSELTQSVLTQGLTYQVNFKVEVTAGTLLVKAGTSGTSQSITSSGDYSIYLDCEGSSLIKFQAGTTFTGNITYITLRDQKSLSSVPIESIGTAVFKTGDTFNLINSNDDTILPLTVTSNQGSGDTTISVSSTPLYEDIDNGSYLLINQDDLSEQYQNKTKGTVAGFDITATGIAKSSINITDWLNSDTMSGAAVTNVPTALSVKNYVDGQVGASDTLQEVTDNGNTTTNSIMIGSSSSPNRTLHITGQQAISNSDDSGAFLFIPSSSDNKIYSRAGNATSSALPLVFLNGNTENMRLTSGGNLGIGTSSPNEKIQVAGNIHAFAPSGIDAGLFASSAAASTTIAIRSNGITHFNGGNVGIGTSNPLNKFVVAEGTNQHGVEIIGGTLSYIQAYDRAISDYGDLKIDAKTIRFGTDIGFERARITSAGNLLLGTTNDSGQKLQVIGSIATNSIFLFDSSSNDRNVLDLDSSDNLQIATGTSSGARSITFLTEGLERARITSGGSLLLGTTTDSGAALNVYKSSNVPLQVFGWSDRIGASNNANGSIYIGNNPSFRGVIDYDATSTVNLIISNTYDHSSGGILFKTRTSGTANDVMILSGDGNVGINQANPTEKLHVVGDALITGDSHADAFKPAATGEPIKFKNFGSSELARFTDGGKLGINNTNPLDTIELGSPAANNSGSLRLNSFVANQFWRLECGTNTFSIKDYNGTSIIQLNGSDNSTTLAGDLILGSTSSPVDLYLFGDTTGVSLTWSNADDELQFSDNAKAVFGDSGDLQIYHDQSNSYIDEAGSGGLYIRANSFLTLQKYTGENMAQFFADSSVRLYYNNSKKLETTNTGIEITGGGVFTDQVTIPATPVASTDAASKGYVDAQVSATDSLQEVTTIGNTTTNNIMIGSSSSPTAPLDVRRSDASGIVAEFHNSTGYGIDIGTSTSDAYISSGYVQSFIFKTNAGSGQIERMRLTSAGNLGIGESNPTLGKLQVNGNIFINRNGTNGLAANPYFENLLVSGIGTTNVSAIQLGNSFGQDQGTYLRFQVNSNSASSTPINSLILNPNGTATFSGNVTAANLTSTTGNIYGSTNLFVNALNGYVNFRSNNDNIYYDGGYHIFRDSDASPEYMRLTSSGNLLIGTTTDSGNAKLQVAGNIEIGNGFKYYTGFGTSNFLTYNVWNINSSAFSFINQAGSGDFGIKTASTERLRITNGGNVLIGTTTDGGHKLEVFEAGDSLSIGDNTNSQTYARFANTRTMVGYGGANAVFQSGLGKGINFNVNNDSFNSGTAVTLTSGGNLLIGTTTDGGEKLQVNSGSWPPSSPIIKLYNGVYTYSVGFYGRESISNSFQIYANSNVANINWNSGILKIGTQLNYNIEFYTGDTTKMTLTSGGNLGIGTSSPATPIDISSESSTIASFRATGGTSNNKRLEIGSGGDRVIIKGFTDTTNVATAIAFNNGNTERMRITSSGSILIGTTTDSLVYRLDVFGKARVQSVFELDDVLTLNQISTPSDPASGKSSIYMDSADGAIKVKINVGGTVVTRTIASFE